MNHLGTKEIKTERLTLRKFCLSDTAEVFQNWASDPNITKYLRWSAHSSLEITRNVLDEWIQSYRDPSFYQWSIVLDEINESVGTISVVDKNEKLDMVHIGYCIGSKWWKKGITSEAFAAIISYFFEEVKVNRIESQHDPNNPNSGRVMRKCGLTYEGTLRQADYNNQGVVDACVYSILADEYNRSK